MWVVVDVEGLFLYFDGVWVFNVVVKLGVDVCEIMCCFDIVSVCLSKGFGVLVGSVLFGLV